MRKLKTFVLPKWSRFMVTGVRERRGKRDRQKKVVVARMKIATRGSCLNAWSLVGRIV